MKGPKVLLVDDEERFLRTSKILMEKRGLDVVLAPRGIEALNVLDEKRIDVVVLDIKMPGMGGIEVLRRIKESHAGVEVILLTGHATVETAVEGLKLGAFDYLMKPCSVNDLVDRIRAASERKEHSEQRHRSARIDEIISHPLAVFDRDRDRDEDNR